jgi:hypothetical protein
LKAVNLVRFWRNTRGSGDLSRQDKLKIKNLLSAGEGGFFLNHRCSHIAPLIEFYEVAFRRCEVPGFSFFRQDLVPDKDKGLANPFPFSFTIYVFVSGDVSWSAGWNLADDSESITISRTVK